LRRIVTGAVSIALEVSATNQLMTRKGWLDMRAYTTTRWRRSRAALAAVTMLSLMAQPGLAIADVSTSGDAPPLGPHSTSSAMTIAIGVNGEGSLTVDGGSYLMLTPPATGLQIGGLNPHTGHGVVRVEGLGSRIDATAPGQFMNVGRFGDDSVGELSIANGGALDTTFLNIGREGATGNVIVDGPGSALRLRGRDAAGNAAGGSIGRDGGTGHLTIRNDGALSIESPDATLSSPGFSLGRAVVAGSGGDGSLTVESGGTLTITGNALGGGVTVGRDEGTTGAMTISSGGSVRINSLLGGGGFNVGEAGTGTFKLDQGTLLLDGRAATATPGFTLGVTEDGKGTLSLANGSTLTINRPANGCCGTIGLLGHGALELTGGSKLVVNDTSPQQGGGFAFGGNTASTVGGSFSALVSGAGTEVTINSRGGGVSVGFRRGASGTFTLSDGAAFNSYVIRLARDAGTTATMNIDGAGTKANLVGDPAAATNTRGLVVGESGTAQVNVTGGAAVQIHAPTATQLAGLQVGGSGQSSGGTGTLVVAGQGSKIETTGIAGDMRVGFDGTRSRASTGAVLVGSGGVIKLDPAAHASIGASFGSTGTLTVVGPGSTVDAGSFLGIGLGRNDREGGTGTVAVSSEGMVKAGAVHVGPNGTLAGNGGTVAGSLSNRGGVVAPGQSPGRLTIDGDYESLGGTLRLEVDAAGAHDLLAIQGVSSFDPSSHVEVRIDPAYRPAADATLDLVRGRLQADAPVQPLLQLRVAAGGGSATLQGPLGTLPATIVFEPVASPATLTAAVLPSSRSVMVGDEATAYVTIINTGSVAAENVVIAPAASLPAGFSFQATNAQGERQGAIDTPVRIDAGQSQTFAISFTPTAPVAPTDVSFVYAGANTAPVAPEAGVNTLLLSASATPVPDIIAIAATQSGDGIVDVPGENGVAAFAVATFNVGAGGLITVAPRLASTGIPATVQICETDPASGRCKQPFAPSVTTQIDADQTPTYTVLVQGEGPIPFATGHNRLFVDFRDADGVARGMTSVAVRTQ
jgi:hypothetical protein